MILPDEVIEERMESPLNLMNRLKSITTPAVGQATNRIPSLPPKIDDVVEDLEEKLAFGGIKNKAVSIMLGAMNELHNRLPEVQRPEKLAGIAEQMGKVISSVATKDRRDDLIKAPQIIIYSPQLRHEREYSVIDLRAIEE